MITIGSRARSAKANPGFSLQELKDECKRRGVDYSHRVKLRGVEYSLEASQEDLKQLLKVDHSPDGTPNVMCHRNLGVYIQGDILVVEDLDGGEILGFWNYIEDVIPPSTSSAAGRQTGLRLPIEYNLVGVTPTGTIVLHSRKGQSSALITFQMEDILHKVSSEILPLRETVMRRSSGRPLSGSEVKNVKFKEISFEDPLVPLGVVGNKFVYREIAGSLEILTTYDLVTEETRAFMEGRMKSWSFRDNYLLVKAQFVSEDPKEKFLTLFDLIGERELWRFPVSKLVEDGNIFLLGRVRFIVIYLEHPILYTVMNGELGYWNMSPAAFTYAGMSKGRLVGFKSSEVSLFDISVLSVTNPKLLYTFTVRERGTGDAGDKVFELNDGKVVCHERYRNSAFLFDPDFQTVDNIARGERNYVILPVREKERKKFSDFIHSNAPIPKEVAAVIERFI